MASQADHDSHSWTMGFMEVGSGSGRSEDLYIHEADASYDSIDDSSTDDSSKAWMSGSSSWDSNIDNRTIQRNEGHSESFSWNYYAEGPDHLDEDATVNESEPLVVLNGTLHSVRRWNNITQILTNP
eukprot:SAG31_NODE_10785_length_1098_cov_1.053053_1_plen_126_part_10